MARAGSPAGVLAEASAHLRALVPFDAAAWVTTDPATGLPTAPVRLDHAGLGLSRAQCSDHWRREFVDDDVNLFRHLARATMPAAGLHATAGDPTRSARYRTFLAPLGLEDELRAVLRAGGSPWGSFTLWRRQGRPPFTRRESRIAADLSTPVAESLRLHARPAAIPAGPGRRDQPGLLIFDAAGHLVSVNDSARAWLAELPDDPGTHRELGIEVPMWMIAAVFHAATGRGDGSARTRVRTWDGHWLVCHASSLHGGDGEHGGGGGGGGDDGRIAVVVDRASPAEIAPIIVEAYGLTEREAEITRLIARGAGTAEIARAVLLSPHTVRDHVKAIFAKTAVTSRGELIAKLYAELYEPAHEHEAAPLPHHVGP